MQVPDRHSTKEGTRVEKKTTASSPKRKTSAGRYIGQLEPQKKEVEGETSTRAPGEKGGKNKQSIIPPKQ